jgi:hypothetical protein
MHAVLTVFNYPKRNLFRAFWAMALFRIPLALDRRISFSRLMGTGRSGSFDYHPDLCQWAVLVFLEDGSDIERLRADPEGLLRTLYGSFITSWWRRSGCETWTIALELLEGHGKWSGRELASTIERKKPTDGPIAVLTRATIRLSRLRAFWSQVAPVSRQFFGSAGLRISLGIGESPFIHQATFSIWDSRSHMQDFAYRTPEHRQVIERTRSENWYREEMFLRFRPLFTHGTLKGVNPFPMN